MSELARLRLARASRNWFSGSELACSADAYVRRLNEQGYASNTINIYLESVAHFAHWSARRHIGLAGINEAAVQRFLKHLPLCRCAHRCQRTRPSGRAALGLLLNLLRSEGRIAEKTSPYPAAIAEEINRFEHYLKQVCGLRPATCSVRLQRVRAFLVDRFAHADIRIIVSADASPPVDRPNLSKDYMAGTAQEEWIPLRPSDYYHDRRIDLLLHSRVSSLDTERRRIVLESGKVLEFGALLLATGADPVHLPIEGATDSQLHYLRTFADSKAIIAKASSAKRVVVVGASFIGLEVAASLRARGILVDVVAPDSQPLQRIMGAEVGLFIRKLHEGHGVTFHLGQTVSRVSGRTVALTDGTHLEADFIVLGVGVRPSLTLAEQAGLAIDRGIAVNEYLETSVAGIFAAGDAARWPDPHTGERIRVEHWVVAERMGQVAAKNILGRREKFDTVPFFWSQHYDVAINYVGHAEKWEAIEIDGSLDARDCAVAYKKGGRTLAIVTISRDLQSLQAEAAMEAEIRPQRQEVA